MTGPLVATLPSMVKVFGSGRISRFRSDSRFRRRSMLIVVTVFLITVVGLTTAWVVITIASSSRVNFSDRLVETGDILTAATLLLTVLAALVALRAYVVSTGLPDLKVRVKFEWSGPNRPVFEAEPDENGWLRATRFKQTVGIISVRNYSAYSAKNPAVIVRLEAMAFVPNSPLADWTINEAITTVGVTVVQWDGGTTYSIHGNSVRQLPSFDFDRLSKLPSASEPTFRIELLADGGYRREVTIPVDFAVDGRSQFGSGNSGEPLPWI